MRQIAYGASFVYRTSTYERYATGAYDTPIGIIALENAGFDYLSPRAASILVANATGLGSQRRVTLSCPCSKNACRHRSSNRREDEGAGCCSYCTVSRMPAASGE